MKESTSSSLSDAIVEYLGTVKEEDDRSLSQQELNRFSLWIGRVRPLSDLSPSEIEEYARSFHSGDSNISKRLTSVKSFLSFVKKRGYTKTSLAPHLKVAKKKMPLGVNQSKNDDIPTLSKDGYKKLQKKLAGLKEDQIRVRGDIQRAMADKDFKENSPLDAAKEHQAYIESNIREIENTLAKTIVSDGSKSRSNKTIRSGNNVTIKNNETGTKSSYTIVHPQEVDPANGKISAVSPVGKALLDRSKGELIEIVSPRGISQYTILKIS